MDNHLNKEFNNRFINNSYTFLILMLLGIIIVILLLIRDKIKNKNKKRVQMGNVKAKKNKKGGIDIITKIEEENKNSLEVKDDVVFDENNLEDLNNSIDEKDEIIINFKMSKYKKCTVESNKMYFLFNYFIRVYLITIMKTTFVCLLVLMYQELDTKSTFQVYMAYFVLIFWVILFPCLLFVYLRKRHKNLMSPDMILRFGCFYLNYRGINRDVYAFIMQIKFNILPIICRFFYNYRELQCIFLIILYLFNIIFVTKYTPFCKVSRVFTEALSEGILMGFGIQIIINIYNNQILDYYNSYITFGLFCCLVTIRFYRIVYDTVYRVLDLIKIKQPILVGVDVPYKCKSESEKKREMDKVFETNKGYDDDDDEDYFDNQSADPKETYLQQKADIVEREYKPRESQSYKADDQIDIDTYSESIQDQDHSFHDDRHKITLDITNSSNRNLVDNSFNVNQSQNKSVTKDSSMLTSNLENSGNNVLKNLLTNNQNMSNSEVLSIQSSKKKSARFYKTNTDNNYSVKESSSQNTSTLSELKLSESSNKSANDYSSFHSSNEQQSILTNIKEESSSDIDNTNKSISRSKNRNFRSSSSKNSQSQSRSTSKTNINRQYLDKYANEEIKEVCEDSLEIFNECTVTHRNTSDFSNPTPKEHLKKDKYKRTNASDIEIKASENNTYANDQSGKNELSSYERSSSMLSDSCNTSSINESSSYYSSSNVSNTQSKISSISKVSSNLKKGFKTPIKGRFKKI